MEQRILKCPVCSFTVTVPKEAELPPEGPTCAMGHEPTKMVQAITPNINRG